MFNRFRKKRIAQILTFTGLVNTCSAALFSTEITFNEPAFPSSNTSVSGTTSYNVLDDSTGLELTALNGDLDDITISVTGDYEYQTTSIGRFTSLHSLTGTVTTNNPGTRITNTLGLNFAEHLSVTDFSFDVSSTNTSGIAYEVTIFQILNVDGSVYNPAPTINPFLTHTPIDGSPLQGVYVLDRTDTVLGVGTDTTSSGINNPNENFTVTGDLELSDFGIASGTQIGGLLITTILEDTRGENNGSTNLTSSFIDFTFSGEIVPEPTSSTLIILGAVTMIFRRSRYPNH